MRLLLALLLCSVAGVAALAQPKRILFVTHSAGYRHDSIVTAGETLRTLAPERFEVVQTEDLSMITGARLRDFQAIFFFTSGELALDAGQKQDLLEYIRTGGGFAGAHSATDTLYGWAEYGDLIGGYFDGHPWVGDTNIDIEDPEHPAAQGLGNSFRILDEIYKFRDFSRERSRVLMTLRSSIGEPGVNKAEYPLDSPLAWCRTYGRGRVFYTALGHFDETWRDPRFRGMLLRVLEWITGEGSAAVGEARRAATPRIDTIAAGPGLEGWIAPGVVVTVTGENLTTGSTMRAQESGAALRLAGTWVWLGNGQPARLVSASPARLEVLIPESLPAPAGSSGAVDLWVAAGPAENRARTPVRVAEALPAIYGVEAETSQISVQTAARTARIRIAGEDLEPLSVFAVRPGVWSIQVRRPASLPPGDVTITVEAGGRSTSQRVTLP